jgi:predicted transcriptional regulator of viral defense system
MKRTLGGLEAQLLAYAQMRGWATVSTGDLRKPLRLSADQERKLFSRLARAGMIARVWRGLYLVPPRLPLGGKWSPDEGLALATLMAARGGGRYQICGLNAFNRYGFDTQIPVRVYAYNNRLSGDRRIGSLSLTLIKVADARLGATEESASSEGGPPAIYCSRARSLVDAVYDWSRFGSLPRGYVWIRRELAAKRVEPADLVGLTLRYGDRGTIRRIGALLDREGVAEPLLRKLERALPATTSPIPWIPRLPKRGRVERRWGVVRNGEV